VEFKAVITLEICVQADQGIPEVVCSADGAEGVILMHLRHAEDRHCRIADELLQRAAVALDDRANGVEIASYDAAQDLRVERGSEAGGIDDVGKENRDGLPPLL
jgi:hypothetical protein